jgi:hypothetical protein
MQWLLPSLTNLNSHRLPRDICRKVHSVVFTCLSSTPGISGGVYIAGLLRQPKWGHLRNLHRAIKQAEPALVSGDPTIRSIGNYEKVKLLLRISPTWQCDCAKCKKKNISRYSWTGRFFQAYVFKSKNGACAAFLSNYHVKSAVRIRFDGRHYDLPAWSISILPDCKTAVFNTATVSESIILKAESFVLYLYRTRQMRCIVCLMRKMRRSCR